MNKPVKYGLILLLILIAFGAAGVWYLSSRDVGTDYVAQTAKNLTRDRLQAELSIGDVSGNPLTGFTAESLRLFREDTTIITVREVRFQLDLLSLVKGSPQIRSVKLDGADLDTLELAKLTPAGTDGPPAKLPAMTVEFTDSTLRTKAGDFLLEDGGITLKPGGFQVNSSLEFKGVQAKGDASFLFGEGKLYLENLDMRTGQGRIQLSGDLFPEVDAGGTLADMDMETLGQLWPVLGGKFSGTFSANIKAFGDWPNVRARGDIAIDKGTVFGISLQGVRSSWWFRGEKLWFEDITGFANGSPLSGAAGLVFSGLPPETHLKLTGTEVNLDTWKKTFPWLSFAGGNLESLEIDLTRSAGVFTGRVSFSAPSMEIAKQLLEAVRASLELKDDRSIKVDMNGKWLDTPVNAKGTVNLSDGAPSLDLTVTGKGLALHKASAIIPAGNPPLQGDAELAVRILGNVNSPRFEGELKSERIRVMEELVNSPRIAFSYDGKSFTMKSFSANWRGLPIKGSGTVSGIGTEKASLNLSGTTDKVKASVFTGLLPALSGTEPAGEIETKWKLSGPAQKPSLALDINSPDLTLPGSVVLKNVAASASFSIPPQKDEIGLKVEARADSAAYGDFSMTELTGKFATGKDLLRVDDFSGKILSGNLNASGIINFAKEKGGTPLLDLEGKLTGVDLETFSKKDFPLSGQVSGSFKVAGPLDGPAVTFEAESFELSIGGYMLKSAAASGTVDKEGITVDAFSAAIGEGTLKGKGFVSLSGESPSANFSVTGTELDLAYLTREVKAARNAGVEGTVDVTLKGTLAEGALSGAGEVFAERLSAYGFTAEDVYAPVSLEGKLAKIQKAQGSVYDGSLLANATLDLGTNVWKIDAEVSGFDIAKAVSAAFNIGGQITGTGTLKASIEHGKSQAMPLTGQGRFTSTGGEISGFKAVEAITAAYGGTGIRYNRAESHFSLGGNMITLMPGSTITAPPGDPLYRYMMVDGILGFSSNLDLHCSGNLNVQALNIFFGALEGLLGTETLDAQQMLQNFLGGFLGGMSRKDFRDVSFDITGTWDKPIITKLKIAVPEKGPDPIPTSEEDENRKGSQQKINIEIPTGGSSSGESVGDQIRQQILQQIFNGQD
ncbi:MAG: hypothetical protein PWR02_1175 [Synergistales bacterium]|nr:hypothetical protein [Synergistales bacterium]